MFLCRDLYGHCPGPCLDILRGAGTTGVAGVLSSRCSRESLVTGLLSSDVEVLTLATRTRPSLPG